MSGGGGKGGTTTQTMELDPRLEEGAAAAVSGALASAGLDFAPNKGVTIAGFTPAQEAAFAGANSATNAFGLTTGGESMFQAPPLETINGVNGYSTGAFYDDAITKSFTPEQLAARQRILDHYAASGAGIAGTASNLAATTVSSEPASTLTRTGDGDERSGHSNSVGGTHGGL